MKPENKELLTLVSVMICVFVNGIIGGYFINNLNLFQNLKSFTNNSNDCSNLTLEESALCLQSELKTFYNYNLSNRGLDLTLEELKRDGGVCWHYSNWYATRMKELGFYGTEVSIRNSKEDTHKFAVASNEWGYCTLDQTKISCIKLN